MQMPHLASLHRSMQAANIERMRFHIKHAHLDFDGVFLADTTPQYQLGLACVNHQFTLQFDVDRNYNVLAYFHDKQALNALMKALNLGKGGQAFSTSNFLLQVDAALPTTASRKDRAQPKDLAPFHRDVEEADKIYLCGWQDNKAIRKTVTPANLAKTRKLLGETTYLWCEQYNFSTKWSDDPRRALRTLNIPRVKSGR